jgi:hypothetical protein
MLRWVPRLQVVTACFSCSPPDLNFLDPYFIFMYMHYNHCHRATAHLQLNILLLLLFLYLAAACIQTSASIYIIQMDLSSRWSMRTILLGGVVYWLVPKHVRDSWFQNFAVFWMLYSFFGWFPSVWILCAEVVLIRSFSNNQMCLAVSFP